MGRNEGLSTVDELEGRHVVETGSLIMQRSRIIADKVDKGACAIVGVTYTLSDGHMRVQARSATSARASRPSRVRSSGAVVPGSRQWVPTRRLS